MTTPAQASIFGDSPANEKTRSSGFAVRLGEIVDLFCFLALLLALFMVRA